MSVSDVSGKAIANLATEELSHPNPVFHGDTLFCETEVLDVKPSKSKPDRGVVKVHTRVLNQDGVLVAEFKRLVLVPRREPGRVAPTRPAMNDLLVLCYHGISETWPASTSVRPGDFERQLDRASCGAATAARRFPRRSTSPPAEKTLVVTFDDAHRSVLELAAPVMARLGVPGTVFVPTGYPDTRQADGLGGIRHLAGHRARARAAPA